VPRDSVTYAADKTPVRTDAFLDDLPGDVRTLREAGYAAFLFATGRDDQRASGPTGRCVPGSSSSRGRGLDHVPEALGAAVPLSVLVGMAGSAALRRTRKLITDTMLVMLVTEDLRSERLAAGVSAAALARAAGTSETNVAAYERGAKEPSPATVGRLRLLLAAGAQSPIFRFRLLTVPAAAAAIRRGLRQGWSTADLLRVVRECLSNAKWAAAPADRSAFFSPPSTTGDRRWDALLAGAVEHYCLEKGYDVPGWTRGKAVRGLWFVTAGAAPLALASSPPSLRVRGVVLDRAELTSV